MGGVVRDVKVGNRTGPVGWGLERDRSRAGRYSWSERRRAGDADRGLGGIDSVPTEGWRRSRRISGHLLAACNWEEPGRRCSLAAWMEGAFGGPTAGSSRRRTAPIPGRLPPGTRCLPAAPSRGALCLPAKNDTHTGENPMAEMWLQSDGLQLCSIEPVKDNDRWHDASLCRCCNCYETPNGWDTMRNLPGGRWNWNLGDDWLLATGSEGLNARLALDIDSRTAAADSANEPATNHFQKKKSRNQSGTLHHQARTWPIHQPVSVFDLWAYLSDVR